MLATVLSLALFAYLAVVGYAILTLLSDEEPLYLLLLAPVIGAAAVMILTFLINQAGVPIHSFAHVLVLLTLTAAAGLIWRRGRRIGAGDFWPFAILIVFALIATGWPMLRFGFDWVSFCNDDMANYCLGAERVLRYGYYQPPDARALAGQDYTQFMWYLHMMHRPGSEMVLAVVSAITRLSPLQIFMPVILTFTLCQICAAGAMAFAAIRSRLAVWLTMGLLSISALVALGTLYQLIAQVIGLGMLAALVAVLLRPMDELAGRSRVRTAILIGFLTAGLVVAYSEMIPFIVVGFGLYLVLTLRSWKANPGRGLAVLGIAAVVMLILLNRFMGLATIYVLGQLGRVPPEDPVTTLFPYYMIPSGPVFFWGMYPLGASFPNATWLSVLVALSLVFSALVAVLVIRSAWRRQAPAVICLVMFAVFATLFHKRSGFGMYKLAMYCQPFILTALVVGWMSLWRRRVVQILPLVCLGLLGARAHFSYVATSLGEGSGAFSEIPNASSTNLVREYAGLLAANPGRPVEVDAYNIVLAKFQMLESRGRAATFPSNDFLGNFGEVIAPSDLIGQAAAQRGGQVYRDFSRLYPRREFELLPDSPLAPAVDPFRLDLVAQHAPTADHPLLFIAETGRQAPFNRWYAPENVEGNFQSGALESFANHLVFTASRLGEPYYTAFRHTVAIYQLETDLLFPDSTMAGMGRFLLFQIVDPSPTVRLEMSLTDSLAGDHENRLPPAAGIGTQRLALPMVGRGSARVFSSPLTPQFIDGIPFVCIDMGANGTFFKYSPGGLMKLWGRNVSLDHRQMVAFVRDVSLISDKDYQALAAPRGIQNFPRDLMNPHLEYSGIYEDGWIGDKGFVMLSQPPGPGRVICRAIVPRINEGSFSTEIVMQVDGKEVVRKTVGLGDVELAADLPSGAGRRRIELSFSGLQHLPDPDGRPVGAELKGIAIEAAVARTTPVR